MYEIVDKTPVEFEIYILYYVSGARSGSPLYIMRQETIWCCGKGTFVPIPIQMGVRRERRSYYHITTEITVERDVLSKLTATQRKSLMDKGIILVQ